MKRGFTLIELLAVIVILAIIAVIAVPIVLNIIDESKENASLRSADFYLDAVEMSVAQATLKNQNIPDDTYNILPSGNICIKYKTGTTTCEEELIIEVNGEHPKEGTIVIENGIVVSKSSTTEATTTMTIGDYTVSYNEEGKLEASKGGDTENGIMYTLEYIQGQTEENIIKYDPVANSKCDSGDTCYSWYVLEDGDLTTLTDGRIAQAGQVSLIMNQNINESYVNWCTSSEESGEGGSCANGNVPDAAEDTLLDETEGWNVSVSLPTAHQLFAVGGSEYDENNSPRIYSSFLYDNLDVDENEGYWMLTGWSGEDGGAWKFFKATEYNGPDDPNRVVGLLMYTPGYGPGAKIRPVITISKDNL